MILLYWNVLVVLGCLQGLYGWRGSTVFRGLRTFRRTSYSDNKNLLFSSPLSENNENLITERDLGGRSKQSTFGIDATAALDNNKESKSENSDIESIVGVLIKIAEHCSRDGSIENIDPAILTENAHVLCRGRLYEEVIKNFVERATNDKISSNLQKIDALMRGFINSERKARSRVKVNYLLAAAAANRFDSAIEALSASEEIDDELLSFVRQLVKKEEGKGGCLESRLNEKQELEYDPFPSKKSEVSDGSNSQALMVLRMIYRRVKAELLMRDNHHFKLLHSLLQFDASQRVAFLESNFRQLDQLTLFTEYLRNAIEFVSNHDGHGEQGGERVQLTADTIEIMRDVMRDVDELRGRLNTNKVDSVLYEQHQNS